MEYTAPIKSPWILPPEKAPKMWSSALILLLGFALLIGTLIYSFYSILSGQGFNFLLFMFLMLLSIVILMWGAVRLAKAYASKKYREIMERMKDMSKMQGGK